MKPINLLTIYAIVALIGVLTSLALSEQLEYLEQAQKKAQEYYSQLEDI